MLKKCTETIKSLETDLRRERDNLARERSEKERLELGNERTKEIAKMSEDKISSIMELVKSDQGKGPQLYEIICNLLDIPYQRSSYPEGKVSSTGGLKEKRNQAAINLNNELRERIKSLEENAERKEILIKEWNSTIGHVDFELKKLTEENQELQRDIEISKSLLNQVDFANKLDLAFDIEFKR